jgi:hypothetical protein
MRTATQAAQILLMLCIPAIALYALGMDLLHRHDDEPPF